ncbi:MAG: SCO family protein [Bacteroidales bacterium]|nr:SCO family protein [Bacteroidales bacterium]
MRYIVILFSLCGLLSGLSGQDLKTAGYKQKEPEIGVVERLGDTIPLDLWFLNEESEKVTLRQLIDKPTVMCFVYFDCPNLCSPLMDGVADVVSKMDMQLGTDYQIITISFNTSDTPEKAREKKVNFVQRISKENQKDWIYLTGTQENISAITAGTGFKYHPQGLDFAHPSVIMVISPAGKITRYLYGLTYLPFDLKMAIIESQKGIARPTANKILEYCFAYNPASKTYTFQVTRIVGVITIFFLILIMVVLLVRRRKK